MLPNFHPHDGSLHARMRYADDVKWMSNSQTTKKLADKIRKAKNMGINPVNVKRQHTSTYVDTEDLLAVMPVEKVDEAR